MANPKVHTSASRQPTAKGKAHLSSIAVDSAGGKDKPITIDALELRLLRRRFLALNNDRLRRIQECLDPRQRVFIQLLPLLFHINHPLLPGYVSNMTPCGICDYAPGKRCIQAARKLIKSFNYRRRAQRRYSIHALYLMGSTGTIAYSKTSDFDVWLCHRPGLSKQDISALQKKADRVRHWAGSLGLEVHFFLMEEVSFRDQQHQQLSNENAGSAQHHLLLDEFYRTSLLVAGRFPVWWVVPPAYEGRYDEYVEKLIVNRFIKANDVVDFGGLAELPSEEFFGATLWQLYKAVDSPYKSILKILLMEAYANQYPDVDILAMRFKKMVHSGDVRLNQIDPYVMMCNTVEEYLFSRRDLERLDLARRCFYFKVNEPMSRPLRGRKRTWRRKAIRELVDTWGWSRKKLLMLDQRRQWKIKRVIQERHRMVDELTRSYRALSRFAREHNNEHSIKSADLNLLGRKLYVAFERKDGKVEMINPGVSKDLSEERLSLHQIDERGQRSWAVYRGNVLLRDRHQEAPLKRTSNLLELLAWCHFNGLIGRNSTAISVQPTDCTLSQWELRCVLDRLQQTFPMGATTQSDMQSLTKAVTIRQACLFVNLAYDPMSKLTRNGMQLVSERIDPLSYGGQWENLAVDFDMIALTSWGEVLTLRYTGENALLNCICDYFAWSPIDSGTTPSSVPCFSFSSSRGAVIARRLEQLFSEIKEHFYNNYWRKHARYALRIAKRYYLLSCEHNIPRYQALDSESALLHALGQAQTTFSPIRIDKYALDSSPLTGILAKNRASMVQLFYQAVGRAANIYVLDERGSLFHQSVAIHSRQALLAQYRRFLNAMRYRLTNMKAPSGMDRVREVQYFQVIRNSSGEFVIEDLVALGHGAARPYSDVQVTGELRDALGDSFRISCDNNDFSTLELGDRIFKRVAEHITRNREPGRSSPVFVTDIDVSPATLAADSAESVQSIHFLNYKRHIENLLNQAIEDTRTPLA